MQRFLNTTLSKLNLDRPPYRYRELAAAASTTSQEGGLTVPQAVAKGSLRATSAGNAASTKPFGIKP